MASANSDRDGWSERFILRRLDDELLVYDLASQRVTALNDLAAQVWTASRGASDAVAIAERLTEAGASVDRAAIEDALELLAAADLVTAPKQAKSDRRGFLRGLLLGGSAAAPLVTSIVAPTPAMGASTGGCLSDLDCPSGFVCLDRVCLPN